MLAAPPARLVDVARGVEGALVPLQGLHRPLEEPLAALARQQAVVVSRDLGVFFETLMFLFF